MRKLFYGWWIVIASSMLTTYQGGVLFYGFTSFFNPIREQFGWSRTATSLAFSLQRLEGGIAAPIVGYFIDKLGPRKMSIFAVIVFGFGFILLSRIDSLIDFYIGFIIISIGQSSGFYSVGAATVSTWFVRRRGKAMGFVTGGVGLAGLLIPVLVFLISRFGWRQSLVIVGLGMWIIGIPLSLVFRQSPEQYGMQPDGDSALHKIGAGTSAGSKSDDQNPESKDSAWKNVTENEFTVWEALKMPSFWLIGIGWSISIMAMSSVFVHVMPFLVSTGISRESAGWIVSSITLISVAGRVGLSWLSDYMDKRYVFCTALALQSIGLLIFANISSAWHIVLFLITFSPGYGGPIPLRAAIQGEYYGRKHFGKIQGLFLSISTIGSMIGPPFAGWICDVTGSYRLAFLILAAMPALGIPCVLLAKRPTPKTGNA